MANIDLQMGAITPIQTSALCPLPISHLYSNLNAMLWRNNYNTSNSNNSQPFTHPAQKRDPLVLFVQRTIPSVTRTKPDALRTKFGAIDSAFTKIDQQSKKASRRTTVFPLVRYCLLEWTLAFFSGEQNTRLFVGDYSLLIALCTTRLFAFCPCARFCTLVCFAFCSLLIV
jgi:hypothetical protein